MYKFLVIIIIISTRYYTIGSRGRGGEGLIILKYISGAKSEKYLHFNNFNMVSPPPTILEFKESHVNIIDIFLKCNPNTVMFFSNEILTKKGGQFAVVWLVGNFNTVHGSRRLGLKKSDYVSVDVVKAW